VKKFQNLITNNENGSEKAAIVRSPFLSHRRKKVQQEELDELNNFWPWHF